MDHFEFYRGRKPKFAEGAYPYKIVGIRTHNNCPTNSGMKDKVSFIFELTVDGHAVPFVQNLYYNDWPQSPYVRFMTMLCESYKTPYINADMLIDTYGTLFILHTVDQKGNIFENVSDMQPDLSEESSLLDQNRG